MSDGELRRRLAAILAADVEGYSRLMALDERAAVAALDAARAVFAECIGANHGRVVDMAGDSVLAVFETASGAVSAALAVQQALRAQDQTIPEDRRMRFRIGVHLDDVFEKPDASVYGDGINIAARLQALADAGGIAVSESVRAAVKGKVQVVFDDCGERQVKNIADRIRLYRVRAMPTGSGDAAEAGRGTRPGQVLLSAVRRLWPKLAALATALVVIAAAWLYAGSPGRRPPSLAAQPVIAVLPLANLSGDPARDYFSDGLTEDLIGSLSLYSGLRVISRQAVARYKAAPVDAQELRRALGARYVVKGSVREAGERVRVTVELSDTDSGIVIWSDRHDGDRMEVFAFQDLVVKNVVGALAAKVTRREEERASAKPPADWQAYDMVLRARSLVISSTRPANRQARQLLAKALELQPDYAEASVVMAWAETQRFDSGWTEDPVQSAELAEQFAQRAIATGGPGAQARAHALLGVIFAQLQKYDRVLAEVDRAVELNPSDARALEARGASLVWLGRPAEALVAFDAAERFDPGGRSAGGSFARALAYYTLRRYTEAMAASDVALARFPTTSYLHAIHAATLAQAGDIASARTAAAETMRLEPYFRAKDFGDRFADPAAMAHLQEGLRKAGL